MTKPIRVKPPSRFVNINEKWRDCHLCSQFYDTQPEDGTIYGGRLYPESELVYYEGNYFCQEHYHWRFDKDFREDYILNLIEDADEAE